MNSLPTGNTLKNRVLRSSAARLLSAAASLGISFFMMPFVLRTLGDRNYGLWVIVASFESYYYFLDLGLNVAASRFVTMRMAKDDHQGVNEAVSTAFVVFSGLGGVVAIVAFIAAAAVSRLVEPADVPTVRALILLTGLNVAIGFPFHAFAGIVYGQMRHDLVETTTVVRRILEGVFVYLALSNGYGLVTYALILIISNHFATAAIYMIANRMWPSLRVRVGYFRRGLWLEFFHFSAWSTLTQISDVVRFKIDALVISGFIGTTAVTHYNVGSRLAELACSLIYRATNFMTPLYARYHATGQVDEIRGRLADFTRVNAFLAFSAGTILILVGDAFIGRWMGEAYVDAYPIMVVLLLGRTLESVSTPANNVLYAISRVNTVAFFNIAEAALNLVLSVILIQRLGIVGVAWGTAIPMVLFRLILLPLYTAKTIDMPAAQYYSSILPSLGISVTILAVLHAGLRPFLDHAGYGRIMAVAALATVLLTAIHALVVLTRAERSAIVSSIPAYPR